MEYKHFSHPHNLNFFKLQQAQQFPCHACKSLICKPDSNAYACWECSFFLHERCGNAARYLDHPSHPLILIPSPTYCSGSFLCDACGKPGNSFTYCCPMCEFDLHVDCALLPQKITSEKIKNQTAPAPRPAKTKPLADPHEIQRLQQQMENNQRLHELRMKMMHQSIESISSNIDALGRI